MSLDTDIAKIASLIGDKTRANILIALMEGKALTASELALRANISPQTASNHLKKLMEAKFIIHIKTPTRYRYYKIASSQVAGTLESLSLLAGNPKIPPRHEKLDKEICFARTCYDHLAGELGVKVTKRLLELGYLKQNQESFSITENGNVFFAKLGINVEELQKQGRQFAKPCLDWTEREYHLTGNLGYALLSYFLDQRWVIRSKKKSRVIILTIEGQQALKKLIGFVD